jgi:hypothetical protein
LRASSGTAGNELGVVRPSQFGSALNQDQVRPVYSLLGRVISIPHVSGLHHRYKRAA